MSVEPSSALLLGVPPAHRPQDPSHDLFPLPIPVRAGYGPIQDRQGEGAHVDGHSEKVSFIWSVADLLRGDYKASDYGKVILPFTVLRRLDCLLEPTKKAVLAQLAKLPAKAGSAVREMLLNRVRVISSRWRFPNTPDSWRKLVRYRSCVRGFKVGR